MKLLTWLIFLPVAALIVVFAVVNRTVTTINLWPLPFEIDLPLFGVIFGGALIGIVWGGIATWLAADTTRARAREWRREAGRLGDENRRLKEQARHAREAASGAHEKRPDEADVKVQPGSRLPTTHV